MKNFALFALLQLVAWPCLIVGAEKPNIIVIYTDDHGWPDIGAADIYDDLKTPHIDALAASGVRATNGYSTAPQCIPSRAGLLSGRSQNRFGVESNGVDLAGFNRQFTIAERLKTAGYMTGQIGKWHLGPVHEISDHGFDDVYSKNANRPCFANYTLDGKTIPGQMVSDGTYHLDACSKAAVAFINRHHGNPFFLYLAYRAPHVPLDAPEKYLSRFPGEMPERRRQALAMISAMDDGVGQIVAELQKKNLYKNTLIFYIGDNGAPLKIHKLDAPGGGPGWDGSLNEPMNGEKGMLTEGGIRVPFLISWPGRIPGGVVYDDPIWTLDVAATAVELAGLEKDQTLDGVNLIPFLSGEAKEPAHSSLKWRWVAQSAIRKGDWKFLKGGNRKYLFDLGADPEEKRNLLAKNQPLASAMESELAAWAGDLQPPGIDVASMSQVWEAYFDFYLEGKPAKGANPGRVDRQWQSRNGSLKRENGNLVISPQKKNRNPFIVIDGLKISGSFPVELELESANSGSIGVAWRSQGQKDFVSAQRVSKDIDPTGGRQKVVLQIPAQGKTIHARIHLPKGETRIRSISFDGRLWEF